MCRQDVGKDWGGGGIGSTRVRSNGSWHAAVTDSLHIKYQVHSRFYAIIVIAFVFIID